MFINKTEKGFIYLKFVTAVKLFVAIKADSKKLN